MNNIDLRRFVDINIEQHVASSINSTRDTVILYTHEGTANTQKLISSLDDAQIEYASFTETLAYLTIFFNNGGVKVLVIEGVEVDTITADMLKGLENKYIVVACVGVKNDVYSAFKTLAITRANDTTIYGINEKILIASTTSMTDSDTVKNFAVKYSQIDGAEMTIAAYLSRTNVYGVDTIYDYSFTQESITEEDLTDANFATIIQNNMNTAVFLANAVRNCGGNCKDGLNLINSYVRIILHQTLTDRLVELLTQKIKNSTGLSKIYTAISQELENYRSSGYLTTDKIWADDDLTISYNNQTYTVIEKGTALTNGYIIKILPLLSLTQEDKAAYKAPPIYVIIADQYGIRQITISGEII